MTTKSKTFSWRFIKVDPASGTLHSGIAQHLLAGQADKVLENVERIPTSTTPTSERWAANVGAAGAKPEKQ